MISLQLYQAAAMWKKTIITLFYLAFVLQRKNIPLLSGSFVELPGDSLVSAPGAVISLFQQYRLPAFEDLYVLGRVGITQKDIYAQGHSKKHTVIASGI